MHVYRFRVDADTPVTVMHEFMQPGEYALHGDDFNSTGVHWHDEGGSETTVVRVAVDGDYIVPPAAMRAIEDLVNFILVPGARPPGSIPEYSRWTYDQADGEPSFMIRDAQSGEVLFRGFSRELAATVVGRHNDDVKRLQYAAYLVPGARPAPTPATPTTRGRAEVPAGINITSVLGPLDDLDDYGSRPDRLVSGEVTIARLKMTVQESLRRLASEVNEALEGLR